MYNSGYKHMRESGDKKHMRECRYNKHIFFYIEPWDGLFYKNSKYEIIGIAEFKKLTELSYKEFYDKHIHKEEKKHDLKTYMQTYLDLEQNSEHYIDTILNKLAVNTKYMAYNKVLDLILEKNLCKPYVDTYEIQGTKKCMKSLETYIIKETSSGIYEVNLPRYKSLSILSNIMKIDKFVKYKII